MSDYVLWKLLTETDFNAMNAHASPGGKGGGARHVALGVATKKFPVASFLGVSGKARIAIQANSDQFGPGILKFSSIPGRRGGEWIIRDQYANRNPAWEPSAGFPTVYDPANPPVILVFRVGGGFHTRLSTSKQFTSLAKKLPQGITNKGIAPATDSLLAAYNLTPSALLDSFEEHLADVPADAFNPANIEDGREKTFSLIAKRQGQGAFRQLLLASYNSRCAISASSTTWVLEAAHIVPYRGKKTNVLQNGLLLRSDIHTLFDLGLISIEPGERKVRVSSLIKETRYMQLGGKPLFLPKKPSERPSYDALVHHFARFRK
ncbi:MAG TPA: HNH endonuclease [Rhizomicrobium sp.]|nr:HNH endonuclease [Rhizomicrobium sp.]